MATRNAVIDLGASASSMGDHSIRRIMWTGLTNATSDVGSWVPFSEWADRQVHFWCANYLTAVASVIGAGGSISIQGTNDYDPVTNSAGYTFAILNDLNNNPLTQTANVIRAISEAPLWIRPAVIAGDGTTNGTVIIVARRLQPMISH